MPIPSQATPTTVTVTYEAYREITIADCHEYTFYISAINYKELPLDANVREPDKKSKPFKAMMETLENSPDKFFENNLGISVVASDVSLKSTNKAVMTFNSGTGILNGGHTQAALLEAQSACFSNVSSAVVRVTVRSKNYTEARIAEIAAAQNSCSNVKEFSLAEKRGLHAEIKKSLDPNKEKSIIWWEGRSVPTKKGMSPQDLIAQLNLFNIFSNNSYYNPNERKQPYQSSRGKGSVYTQWENSDDATLDDYKKLYPLVNDILDLGEYIQASFHKNTGMTKFQIISDSKKSDGSRKTLFNQYVCEYDLPSQMLYVVLAAFRANVFYDANLREIGWFYDNYALFDKYKDDLFSRVKEFFKTNGNDPNKFSRGGVIWENLYNGLGTHIDRTSTPVKKYGF